MSRRLCPDRRKAEIADIGVAQISQPLMALDYDRSFPHSGPGLDLDVGCSCAHKFSRRRCIGLALVAENLISIIVGRRLGQVPPVER